MPELPAQHAFVSYVHEDADAVDQLVSVLQAASIPVWKDTEDLWPGEDWRQKIRGAIEGGSLAFIACFSSNSVTKAKTYSAKFGVAATLTDENASLSLADGEVASGSKLGHLTSGSKRLPLALEARVGKGAFQKLDSSVDQVERPAHALRRHGQPASARQEQGLRELPQGHPRHAFHRDAVGASRITEEEKQGDTRSEPR